MRELLGMSPNHLLLHRNNEVFQHTDSYFISVSNRMTIMEKKTDPMYSYTLLREMTLHHQGNSPLPPPCPPTTKKQKKPQHYHSEMTGNNL